MRFLVCDWAHEAKAKLADLGYKHNDEFMGDVWNTAKRIFDAGLNVMVCHVKKDFFVLYVDTKRFSQR